MLDSYNRVLIFKKNSKILDSNPGPTNEHKAGLTVLPLGTIGSRHSMSESQRTVISSKLRIGTSGNLEPLSRAVFAPNVGDETPLKLLQDRRGLTLVEVLLPLPPGDRVKGLRREDFDAAAGFRRQLLQVLVFAEPLQDPGHQLGSVGAPVVAVEAGSQLQHELVQNGMVRLEFHDSGSCKLRQNYGSVSTKLRLNYG